MVAGIKKPKIGTKEPKMGTRKGRKRPKPDSPDRKTEKSDGFLTIAAKDASPSERCWKCKGSGVKFQKSTQSYDGPTCKVCDGEGIRKRSKRSDVLASAPGKILNLRGYPGDHPLRKIFKEGFSGPRAFWGKAINNKKKDGAGDLPRHLLPNEGEVVGSLGCGDWRIFQIADGNKLTVDDFVCAWVAAEEMRKRDYGSQLHRENPTIKGGDIDGEKSDNNEPRMFGGKTNNDNTNSNYRFNHADIGTGCGSVLMMTAWAFMGEIQSIGVEAQEVSFGCLKRGLEWNIGSDGTSPDDSIQIRHNDLRTWDGCGINKEDASVEGSTTGTTVTDLCNESTLMSSLRPPYRLITGTPPYFPLDSFVASQNHEQKVRCRVPTRGGAQDYIEAASRFLLEEQHDEGKQTENENSTSAATRDEGVFCMVEAAFDKAEAGVLEAVKKHNMRVQRRVDVITRTGLPPRFSCWVMTKKKSSTNYQATAETLHKDKETEDKKLVGTLESTCEKDDSNIRNFPIETLTLRNADLTRTKEYTDAMEIMGWVDFEKSQNKRAKSIMELDVAKES